jgi:hypothetical protein
VDKLISDYAKVEMSKFVNQILCALLSAPGTVNPSMRIKTLPRTDTLPLKRRQIGLCTFLVFLPTRGCLHSVCLLLNHLASAALGWKSPEQVLTGQRPDISKFLIWWVGIATHVGDVLTYMILTKHNKVIYHSAIRSALGPAKRIQRLSHLEGRIHQLSWWYPVHLFKISL